MIKATPTRRSRCWFATATALLVATTLISSSCCSAFHLQQRPHQHAHRGGITAIPLSLDSVAVKALRGKSQDEDSSSSEDAPFLPFGISSLDSRTKLLSTSSSKTKQSGTKEGLPFGFNIENTAAIEQIMLNTVTPMENALDALTGDWAMSYADLRPDNTSTIAGRAFLVTNAAYLVAGIYIFLSGDLWFGFWTDMAAIASFNYHYNQLLAAGQAKASAVRLALLLDYTAAAFSIITATAYLFTFSSFPILPIAVSTAGLGFLYLSWVWEYGRPYMFWHSLWHLCSAYSGFLIGTQHSNP